MGRLTDWIVGGTVVASGDQIPLTVVVNPDGSTVGSSVAGSNQRAVKAEGGGTTSATAGQSTTILPADPTRIRFEIQNLGTAPIFVRVNQGAATTAASTATPASPGTRSIAVPAGQLYVTESDVLCTGQINVASGTASVPYSYFAS